MSPSPAPTSRPAAGEAEPSSTGPEPTWEPEPASEPEPDDHRSLSLSGAAGV